MQLDDQVKGCEQKQANILLLQPQALILLAGLATVNLPV